MAIPGVLHPVIHDNRLLIDGGTVNPFPFDALRHTAYDGSDRDTIQPLIKQKHGEASFTT